MSLPTSPTLPSPLHPNTNKSCREPVPRQGLSKLERKVLQRDRLATFVRTPTAECSPIPLGPGWKANQQSVHDKVDHFMREFHKK